MKIFCCIFGLATVLATFSKIWAIFSKSSGHPALELSPQKVLYRRSLMELLTFSVSRFFSCSTVSSTTACLAFTVGGVVVFGVDVCVVSDDGLVVSILYNYFSSSLTSSFQISYRVYPQVNFISGLYFKSFMIFNYASVWSVSYDL